MTLCYMSMCISNRNRITYNFGTSSNRIFCRLGSSCNVAKATGKEASKSKWNGTPEGGFRKKFLLS
jgi:hypothetical protein